MVNDFFRRPPNTDLGNWRESPYSQWAFQNVRELIPTARIATEKAPPLIKVDEIHTPHTLSTFPAASETGIDDLDTWLKGCETDCLLLLHKGKKIWQWQASHFDANRPHIVFSVSKSITAILAGILVKEGLIKVNRKISYYLPGTRGSAYEDSTVQQVLDMQVALAFEEEYLNPSGDYFRYRNATSWNPVNQTLEHLSLEPFLYSLQKANYQHGRQFAYKSPNSDLLGLLLERVSGLGYAELLSQKIWKPMGAQTDGYVTVDRRMLARGAGGICATADDLALFGQLILGRGAVGTKTIIPEEWIQDTFTQGDSDAWKTGGFTTLLPNGRYRNKWYQVGDDDRSLVAMGIHGQWLYINPSASTVIVRLSSQATPVDDNLDTQILEFFSFLSRTIRA